MVWCGDSLGGGRACLGSDLSIPNRSIHHFIDVEQYVSDCVHYPFRIGSLLACVFQRVHVVQLLYKTLVGGVVLDECRFGEDAIVPTGVEIPQLVPLHVA